MSESAEVVKAVDLVLMPDTFEGTLAVAKVFAASGFFHDARQEAQALVKIMAGRELGFAPFASMTGIFVSESRNGRPARLGFHANLMAAAVKRSGRYDYEVRKLDDTGCVLAFVELRAGKRHELGVSPFTIDDAKRAGLAGGVNYQAFPRNMTFARALSNGVKWYCPDVFGGPVYTPEELEEDPAPPDRKVVIRPEEVAARVVQGEVVAPPAAEATNGAPPPTEETPPSYEPWGAINMVTELASGKFDQQLLARYFGGGVRNKTALERLAGSDLDKFRAGYDRLRADYQAGKAGAAAPGGVAA